MPEVTRERLVVIAISPEGKTVAVGPVGSRAAAVALRNALERHGWEPIAEWTAYMSRAEWYRAQGDDGGDDCQPEAAPPVHLPSGGERIESAAHRLLGLPEGFR